MKHRFIFSTLLIALLFASCDGKDRARKNHEEKMANSNLSISFFERSEFFPKEYSEVITDTILNNGFRVHIKTFSNMQSSYLKQFVKDSITYKHYYRNYVSKVSVWKQNQEVFFKTLNKDFFKQITPNKDLLKETTFHNIWLDERTSTFTNTIVLNALFCKPKTDHCIVYQIKVNDTGEFTIIEKHDTY